MEYFFGYLSEITKKIQGVKKCALMFDFDGTLSKISPTPGSAFLSKTTKKLLEELSRNFNVAIISGRELSDLKGRVGISGLIYAGSHGQEWDILGFKKTVGTPLSLNKKLLVIKKELEGLVGKYPKCILEIKPFSLAINYRLLSQKDFKDFWEDVGLILEPLKKEHSFLILNDKKTLEIKLSADWHKGTFVGFLTEYLEKKDNLRLLTFYVGDSQTDEDAFRSLASGVTIRIGRRKNSAAKYYIKSQKQIDKFLLWLLKNVRKAAN